MSLLERLAQEIKAAMLAKDKERLSALRLLKSAVGYAQIERQNERLSGAEGVGIVQKEIKQGREASEHFEKGGRPELASQEKLEITALEGFLPPPPPPEGLERLVRSAIQEVG